jgi:hypothetical protein
MHIILGDQITKEISDRYIVLELDNFEIQGRDHAVPAYCLVEKVPMDELPQAHQFRDLHVQMIKNYRLGNWKFCEDALEHLIGRWNGEVDSFYHDLSDRVAAFRKDHTDPKNWNPTVKI